MDNPSIYKGLLFIGEKDNKIGRIYNFFTLFLSFLLLNFIVLVVFTYSKDELTWHFTLLFLLAAGIVIIFLSRVLNYRYEYIRTPKKLIEVYSDRFIILSDNITVSINKNTYIKIKKYKFKENTGSLYCKDNQNKKYVIRDISDINKLKSLISELYTFNKK